MSHNLKVNLNGEIAMAYDQEAGMPWHSLGTPMQGRFTPEEAKRVFPFTMVKEEVFLKSGEKIPNFCAVIKEEENTKVPISIMGADYSILQPYDALAIIQDLELQCDTAMALGNGEVIIVNCVPKELEAFEVIKGDEIKPYILFCTSYDGSHAREMRNVAVRTVCQNTFRMACGEAKPFFSIKNTKNADARTKVGVELLKLYLEQAKDFKEIMAELVKHPINDELVNLFIVEMFGDKSITPEGRASTILKNKVDKFSEILVTGKGTDIKGVVGSAYGLINAYVEWADFYSPVRRCTNEDGKQQRTNSILFGQAATDKSHALDAVMDLVGVKVNK